VKQRTQIKLVILILVYEIEALLKFANSLSAFFVLVSPSLCIKQLYLHLLIQTVLAGLAKRFQSFILSPQIEQSVTPVKPAFSHLRVWSISCLVKFEGLRENKKREFVLTYHVEGKSFVVVKLRLKFIELNGSRKFLQSSIIFFT
jgi:hypothetical protein